MPRLARQALKWSAVGADRLRPPPPGVVVLIYHRVGARTALDVDLPIGRFEEQMQTLAETGRVCSIDAALDRLERPGLSGGDPIVITFDDGTADFADLAMPVLDHYQLPATLYVATEVVDQRRAFPHDGLPLSWAALGEARASGLITVGSHTHTHALLDRLPAAAIEVELDVADDLIETHLGARPTHFAYPKAVAGSSLADAAVRTRYRSAALAGTRPNRYGQTDPHRLARTPIQRSDGMRFFGAKLQGGMHLEDRLRMAANKWRYRDATE